MIMVQKITRSLSGVQVALRSMAVAVIMFTTTTSAICSW